MKLWFVSMIVLVALLLAVDARAHNVPGSEHNRRHAITYAFCHTLRPCSKGEFAIRVFNCESGGGLYPWARNGQYLGFAQMGTFARGYAAAHGAPWSWSPWAQARSAAVLQHGLGWSQWSCA